jgi:hypothetical protein
VIIHWNTCVWFIVIEYSFELKAHTFDKLDHKTNDIILDILKKKGTKLWGPITSEEKIRFYESSNYEKYLKMFYYSQLLILGNDISP